MSKWFLKKGTAGNRSGCQNNKRWTKKIKKTTSILPSPYPKCRWQINKKWTKRLKKQHPFFHCLIQNVKKIHHTLNQNHQIF